MNSEVEWRAQNQSSLKTSAEILSNCQKLRNLCTSTVDTKKIHSQEGKKTSDDVLEERRVEVHRHLKLLKSVQQELNDELELIRDATGSAREVQIALESKKKQHEELEALRKERPGAECVQDAALECLEKELVTVDNGLKAAKMFKEKFDNSLNKCEQIIGTIEEESLRKSETLEIEEFESKKGSRMGDFAANENVEHPISPLPSTFTSKQKAEIAHAKWISNTLQHIATARNHRQSAQCLRGEFQQFCADLVANCQVAFSRSASQLRRRKQDTWEALERLKHVQSDLQDELEAYKNEAAHSSTTNQFLRQPQNLCASRLEARQKRPGIEKCHDKVSRQLVSEKAHVDQARKIVRNAQSGIEKQIEILGDELAKIRVEIEAKNQAFCTETKAVEMHEKMRFVLVKKKSKN